MKTLVAYFSCTGTTQEVAKELVKVVNGDLFEIQPQKLYTTADLDWRDKSSRSTVEMRTDPKIRPAIANKVQHFDDYEVIYIGFPIWWYTAPTIINTFIESYNFSGKEVFFFATSGGSGIDDAVKNFKQAYPKLDLKGGKLLNGADKSSIEAWALE